MADRLVEMEAFLRAADTGSFAAAAARLGLSAQMIGRHVAAIEQRLGARLLNRSTRRQSLTEAGRLYLEGCRRTLAELDAAETSVLTHTGRPRGLLRITAPVAFGAIRLVPDASRFLALYPDLRLQFDLTDRRVNLIEDAYDVAIRIGDEPDSALISRPLAPYQLVACAAPDYVSRHGVPSHPDDLHRHECLDYVFSAHPSPPLWQFRSGQTAVTVRPAGRLLVNDARALIEAALNGTGIVMLADMLVADHLATGRLVRMLPDYTGPSRPMRLLFAAGHARDPKLRAFIDWTCKTYGRNGPGS